MSEKQKNEHAVALGKLRKGIKEKFSEKKYAAQQKNMVKARAARWPKDCEQLKRNKNNES